jgi:hypothetical protein
MSRKYFSKNVKGHDWKFYGQRSSSYVRMHGKDSAGISYPGDKEVYFNLGHLSPENVRHEVMHVYVDSTSTHSMLKDADDAEELCAQLYGEHGPEMDLLVDQLLEFLMNL